jgi:hypothetical protein
VAAAVAGASQKIEESPLGRFNSRVSAASWLTILIPASTSLRVASSFRSNLSPR